MWGIRLNLKPKLFKEPAHFSIQSFSDPGEHPGRFEQALTIIVIVKQY